MGGVGGGWRVDRGVAAGRPTAAPSARGSARLARARPPSVVSRERRFGLTAAATGVSVSSVMTFAGALALEAALEAEASQEEAAVAVYIAMLSASAEEWESVPCQ